MFVRNQVQSIVRSVAPARCHFDFGDFRFGFGDDCHCDFGRGCRFGFVDFGATSRFGFDAMSDFGCHWRRASSSALGPSSAFDSDSRRHRLRHSDSDSGRVGASHSDSHFDSDCRRGATDFDFDCDRHCVRAD